MDNTSLEDSHGAEGLVALFESYGIRHVDPTPQQPHYGYNRTSQRVNESTRARAASIAAASGTTIGAVIDHALDTYEDNAGNGLVEISYARCEDIRSVSERRLMHRLGRVDTLVLLKVARTVKTCLELGS